MDPSLTHLLDDQKTLLRLGLIVERGPDGVVRANVEHMKLHSRDFECGYCGSGPADLALSALNALFPPSGHHVSEALGLCQPPGCPDSLAHQLDLGWSRVPISALAFKLHHRFEHDFIARMPQEGGVISVTEIKMWLAANSDPLSR